MKTNPFVALAVFCVLAAVRNKAQVWVFEALQQTRVMARLGTKVLPVVLSVLCVFQLPGAQQTERQSRIGPASKEFFERQVRPILTNRCYPCHGPAAGQG